MALAGTRQRHVKSLLKVSELILRYDRWGPALLSHSFCDQLVLPVWNKHQNEICLETSGAIRRTVAKRDEGF